MSVAGTFTDELDALGRVLAALQPLTDEQRRFVFKAAADRLGLSVPIGSAQEQQEGPQANAGISGQAADSSERLDSQSPKDFIKAKSPDSETIRVACLAYYLTHARGKPHFKAPDVVALNTEAACQRFGNALKAVNNAAGRNGFLVSAGGGAKQISSYGESVVETLPDYAKVKLLMAEHSKKRRSKASSKKRTKLR